MDALYILPGLALLVGASGFARALRREGAFFLAYYSAYWATLSWTRRSTAR